MTAFDFNDAPLQVSLSVVIDDGKERVERLRTALNARAPEVLSHLLPAGQLYRDKFLVGDVHNSPGDSLDVCLEPGPKFGMYHDFATGQGGGDLLQLWREVRGVDFKTTLEEVEKFLGNGFRPYSMKTTKAPVKKTLKHTQKWTYTDAAGAPLAYHNRYEDPETGKKEFRPYDVVRKKWGFPDPRPLYNLQGISQAATVVIVEGEKCADALIALGVCATTCMGGANAPMDKVDFEPLRGKDVLIWPDNDEPGRQYARNVAEALG